MAITHGSQYVFCPAATYIGSVGVGKGCIVGTKNVLLGLPVEVQEAVWNDSITTKSWSIGGQDPGAAIQEIAQLDDTTLEGFEGYLESLSKNCPGAVFVEVAKVKRLKVRAGLCTKGVYWSDRESGPGWSGYGMGSKELTLEWMEFYRSLPNFV